MPFHKRHLKKELDRFLSAPVNGEDPSLSIQTHIINTIEHNRMNQPMPEPQVPLPPAPQRPRGRMSGWFAVAPFAGVAIAVVGFVLTSNLTKHVDTFIPTASAELRTFASAEEFTAYITEAQEANGAYGVRTLSATTGVAEMDSASFDIKASNSTAGTTVDRSSTTNVQVKGIDEPDLVKTNGTDLFVSQEGGYYATFTDVIAGEKIAGPDVRPVEARTFDISTLPVDAISTKNIIDKNGQLLLVDKMLLVFGANSVAGYDVSGTAAEKKWEYSYGEDTSYYTARLIDSTVYLISSTYVSASSPCPLVALKDGDRIGAQVLCTDIYHPVEPTAFDSTYTITKLNAETGAVQDTVGFTGGYSTVVYMSPTSIYLTYNIALDTLDVMEQFLSTSDVRQLVGNDVLDRLNELQGYNISDNAKMSELMVAFQKAMSAGTDDEQEERGEKFEDLSQAYAAEHKRELQQTGIARFDVASLDLAATGAMPGEPLNQFSLDEYQNHLRVTTTVGNAYVPFLQAEETVNDLVIFDKELKQVSTVQDLGKGERIYSTRFVDDVAYMVTFKQVDPFFVFDLSNATNPRVRGELKIPGYSSYLHPISDTRVLGIGQEDNHVKATLFDVSDLDAPKELSTLKIDDAFWTEVQNNHHAFLLDAEHKIFFMPADQHGYVVSYDADTLTLKKEVTGVQVNRAVYVNNNLYTIGSKKLKVFSENTWEELAEYTFVK